MTVAGPGGEVHRDELDALDEEIVDDEGDGADGGDQPSDAWRGPSLGRWILFAAIAIAVVVADQVGKAWVIAQIPDIAGPPVAVLGEWLRVVHWENSGILFGLLPRSGPAFAVVSLVVVVLIGVYHARAGRGIVTTLALALLLGGAIGNLLDRVRFGAVVDWIDMGIGDVRFWTYNLGDAAITSAIVLLLVTALFPRIAEWGADG